MYAIQWYNIDDLYKSTLFGTRATKKPSWFWSVVNVAFIINSLTTVGYLLGVVFRLWIPFWSVFHFCLESALETWAKASLTPPLRAVHDPNHTHSLVSFQWSGFSDQRALQLTESCLQIQKWCPYKARGVVPEPICANKARNGQGSCHVHGTLGWTHPPPPIPPFLLVQNLSSKRIAPTDNMRPKSDDAIWRHRWLKG